MTRGLNSTGIEYVHNTWNPVHGCKGPDGAGPCYYCYAERMAKRLAGRAGYPGDEPFRPVLYEEVLDAPLRRRSPTSIFAVSMGDLWGSWVPASWRNRVLEVVEAADQHTFMMLTKSPWGYDDFQHRSSNYLRIFPSNLWIGVTVDTPAAVNRLTVLRKDVGHARKMASFEPLRGDVAAEPGFSLEDIGWVTVGAMTNPGRQPRPEWVEGILDAAEEVGALVFLKDNLLWPGMQDKHRRTPEGFP